jgi:CheY-like chemotaxis protein
LRSLKNKQMKNTAPIVIVDDDVDDQEIFEDVMKELEILHQRVYFTHCKNAFDYLQTTPQQPFLILCDINLPEMNGLEFKKQIDANGELRRKSIPFIFFSTSAGKNYVHEAFTQMTVQGFFKKEHSIDELKKTITVIMDYWKLCKHPNS